MAERFRDSTSFYYGGPRRASQSDDQSLGPRKTLLVLVVVAGCFAVLWPKVFYPMLVNSTSGQIKPGPVDKISAIRQERPTHIRPEMVHPAFKERGRAIPQPEVTSSRRPGPPPRIVEGRPGPIPGMRPAMGGAGHIVPPSKQSNNGFLGVLMPIYTVGFVVFFTYTIMKLVFKKKTETYSGSSLYPPVDTDDHQFQKEVFESSRDYYNRPNRDNSKIGEFLPRYYTGWIIKKCDFFYFKCFIFSRRK